MCPSLSLLVGHISLRVDARFADELRSYIREQGHYGRALEPRYVLGVELRQLSGQVRLPWMRPAKSLAHPVMHKRNAVFPE